MEMRLREFRHRSGLSLEQAAERLDSSAGHLSKIERGEVDISGAWLVRFASLYRCAPADLIAGPHILTDDERQLLARFRSLPAAQQVAIVATLAALSDTAPSNTIAAE